MTAKIFDITGALILVSVLTFSSGCSKSAAPETTKNGNLSQSTANVNNSVVSANMPINTMPAANNTVPPPPPTITNGDKKPAPAVKAPTPQIGSGAEDLTLFAQARSALSSDSELLKSVVIEIKEGSVVLSGSVSSEAQKTKAAQLVQTVKGIKSVKNNLRVSNK